ncbi:hypothetical protein [Paraliomyxa miuraensis]|uniref:hypothetical protein n=1 Tax=Paraliomyxa miuraensis TaxID=376150 RepID=UPI0022593456|nr:hypothetical protein [Paraliomyxa miuraensis]MCX4242284.1 hypothetical protein [Paraliomyxa miuraensis]
MASRRRSWGLVCGLGLVCLSACPDPEDPPNVLPSADGSGSSGDATGEPSTGEPDTNVETSADTTEGTALMFPVTYRFDCIDVMAMGDSNGDGQADGDAIQATLLENTWTSDIDGHKLNIMLTVASRDDVAGMAELLIGSGIGTSNDDLCAEPTTASDPKPAMFAAGEAQWQVSGASDACAEPAAGGATAGGTYTFVLPPSDTIYIYAEDDDGTVFNCVPGGEAPNAVPLHAIEATVTVNESEQISAGVLTGCLVESEAQNLCSCLGQCSGSANPDCGGCPNGSIPLAQLLGGVSPTDRCTGIMGETAFDMTVGFTTRRIGVDDPMVCG